MLPTVAIAIGDPSGIGPEISIKAALDPAARAICRPVLVGDRGVLEAHAKSCGLTLEGVELMERKQLAPGQLKIGEIRPAHGQATLDSAKAAVRAALSGKVQAVVAAPHNESAIHQAGIEFDGYPSFVARLCGLPAEDGILMLCFQHEGREIRIAHVTLHTSVAHALTLITAARVARTIREVAGTLRKLGIERPRLAISGLNPHASENGLFGHEEITTLAPALSEARAAGIAVGGAVGADLLIQKKGYDAFIVMLHDQGHIPAKLLAPQRVAGMTIGTPVIFSSVAHGSAHDIAGKNRANHGAMLEALARVTGNATASP
jgi:4-hydroxy-L-threonine phosphate dehydrogenase PdxA